jgi:hypothetical protein
MQSRDTKGVGSSQDDYLSARIRSTVPAEKHAAGTLSAPAMWASKRPPNVGSVRQTPL